MSVAEQRFELVRAMMSGETNAGEVCAAFGVSRKTGYKWKARYEAEGVSGLVDRSHAPLRHGRATAEEIAAAIVNLKHDRPEWGPRKIVARLERRWPEVVWPSHSTAGGILKRAGLVAVRRRIRQVRPTLGPLRHASRCNEVWTADHKGWVRLGDGSRCEPLTVCDRASRYLVALHATTGTDAAQARAVFEAAFRDHGLPEVIRTDNGAPFAASGVVGLTQLSAWFVQLGIELERIAPGKPQQNGAHERFHATLKEAMSPPEAGCERQQARFDAFRETYNMERPHEALKMAAPGDVYEKSARPMPDRTPEPDYAAGAEVRKVRPNGEIKWRGGELYISQAIAGSAVSLEDMAEAGHAVRYFDLVIGLIPRNANRLHPTPKLSPIHPG
jgi:transposase InsO family protein